MQWLITNQFTIFSNTLIMSDTHQPAQRSSVRTVARFFFFFFSLKEELQRHYFSYFALCRFEGRRKKLTISGKWKSRVWNVSCHADTDWRPLKQRAERHSLWSLGKGELNVLLMALLILASITLFFFLGFYVCVRLCALDTGTPVVFLLTAC